MIKITQQNLNHINYLWGMNNMLKTILLILTFFYSNATCICQKKIDLAIDSNSLIITSNSNEGKLEIRSVIDSNASFYNEYIWSAKLMHKIGNCSKKKMNGTWASKGILISYTCNGSVFLNSISIALLRSNNKELYNGVFKGNIILSGINITKHRFASDVLDNKQLMKFAKIEGNDIIFEYPVGKVHLRYNYISKQIEHCWLFI
jgi:hypothetical protein